jgi:hypothetical protein
LPAGWSEETVSFSTGHRVVNLANETYRIELVPGSETDWPTAYLTRTDGQVPTDAEAVALCHDLFGDELNPEVRCDVTPREGPTEVVIDFDHPEPHHPSRDLEDEDNLDELEEDNDQTPLND